MADSGAEIRWQEIRQIWKQNQWLYILSGILIGLLVGPFLDMDKRLLLESIIPEAVGIIFTVLVLNRFAAQREQARFKADLIHRMGSSVNNEARRAVEELRRHGWLTDGTLKGADFQGADLEGANLEKADLRGVDLHYTNLKGARLGWASLQKANLDSANLVGARLIKTDLREASLVGAVLNNAILAGADLQKADMSSAQIQSANLRRANLQQADLWDAKLNGSHLEDADLRKAKLTLTDLREAKLNKTKLQGAILVMADLRGVDLSRIESMYDAVLVEENASVIFDESTILPNGRNWTPNLDLTLFVNPPESLRNFKPIVFAVPEGKEDEAVARAMQRLLNTPEED